jgi:hypothetical protein
MVTPYQMLLIIRSGIILEQVLIVITTILQAIVQFMEDSITIMPLSTRVNYALQDGMCLLMKNGQNLLLFWAVKMWPEAN